jgi:hypothetical protein
VSGVDQLTASDGVISAKNDPTKKVSYGQLVGGKKFNLSDAFDQLAFPSQPKSWLT